MSKRALIIGCGRIAGGFNEADESSVLTHVVAWRELGVEVVGCCDARPAQAARFARRWNIEAHGADLVSLLKSTRPEVVSICTPPHGRLETLRAVLLAPGVRSVLLEKPVATSASEAGRMLRLASVRNRPVVLNYQRAFDPFYLGLEKECRVGGWGNLCAGTARYYGSAESNASHWLERMLAMFGPVRGIQRWGGRREAPVFELAFGHGEVLFLPAPDCRYSPFELDLFFPRRRIRVIDSESRVERFVSRPDPRFPGYENLVPVKGSSAVVPASEAMLRSARTALAAATARSRKRDWFELLERGVEVVRLLEKLR